MTLMQKIFAEVERENEAKRTERADMDEKRKEILAGAVNILKRLGFTPTTDTTSGRWDAMVLVGKDKSLDTLRVGVFYSGSVGILSPHRFRPDGEGWIRIRPDLSNLAMAVEEVVREYVRNLNGVRI